jgi:circadian clock protein KaiB
VSDFLLLLYVAGNSATSQRAIVNMKELQRTIGPKCKIEIVDVITNPELAEQAGVLATPTLSYEHPERPRRIIGDLSDTERVLEFLGIEGKENMYERTGRRNRNS